MECKLSVENTRLEKENERLEKQLAAEREMDRKRRSGEQEWFREYKEKMCGIMGMRYPDQHNFKNFQECINEFIKRVEASIPPDECKFCYGSGKVGQSMTKLPKGKCPLCKGTKLQQGKLRKVEHYERKLKKK